MMTRVVVVDDEPLIRSGLIKLINNHHLNWQVVAEASNGQEAINLLPECEPHLVITDICMPILDGIGVAKHIYEKKLPILVVILTGYPEFGYAKAALSYGVVDFLLKPSSLEETNFVLTKAYERIRERVLQHQSEQRIAEELIVRSVVMGTSYDTAAAALLWQHILGKRLLFFTIRDYTPPEKEYQEKDRGLLQFAMHNIMLELLEQYRLEARIVSVNKNLTVLLMTEADSIEAWCSEMTEVVSELLGLTVFVQDQGAVSSWGDLAARYDAMTRGLSRENDHNVKEHSENQSPIYKERLHHINGLIMSYLAIGRPGQVKEELTKQLLASAELSLPMCKAEALAILMAMTHVMNREFGYVGKFPLEKLLTYITSQETKQDVIKEADVQLQDYFQHIDRWFLDKKYSLVTRAKHYVENHYSEACNISEIAAHLYVSPNHLGNLFKKETGDTLTNYVTLVRMERAKMLLANADMKITDIALSAGFANSNYFATQFKELFGISPKEYRSGSRQDH